MAHIPSSSIQWLFITGQMAGLDMGGILRETNIDPAIFKDEDGQLPLEQATQLRERVLSQVQDTAFALHTGENIPIGELGVVDYICVSSCNVQSAMENLERYFRLVAHPYFSLAFYNRYGDGVLEYQKTTPSSHATNWFEQQSTEFTFAVTISRIRQTIRTHVIPKSVHFCHPEPDYSSEYERLFQAPIYFDEPVNAMVLPQECLHIDTVPQDTRLHQMLRYFADQALKSLPPSYGVVQNVLEILQQEFESGDPSVAAVANKLHMSERTLHRRLKEEDTSFADLRDKMRCEMAQSMLCNQSMAISDIAFLLGFSQPSAFHRAFKRWTGSAPHAYRERSSFSGAAIKSTDSV